MFGRNHYMSVTDRDIRLLDFLRPHKHVATSRIREAIFPNDKDGTTTRTRLKKLREAGFVVRHRLRHPQVPEWIVIAWALSDLGFERLSAGEAVTGLPIN